MVLGFFKFVPWEFNVIGAACTADTSQLQGLFDPERFARLPCVLYGFPTTVKKYTGRQIDYTKLALGVNECVTVCAWCPGVLSSLNSHTLLPVFLE